MSNPASPPTSSSRWGWKTLLRPATGLMHRLRYPQKLALVSLLFLLPLATVSFLLIRQLDYRIAVVRQELQGIRYLQQVQQLTKELLLSQLAGMAYACGEHAAGEAWRRHREPLAAKLRDVEAVDQRLGDVLASTPQWRRARAAVEQLITAASEEALERQRCEELYSNAFEELARLNRQVGDSSQLILDSRLDTYYLMEATLIDIPEFQALAAESHRLARLADAAGAQGEPQTRVQFHMLLGRISETHDTLTRALRIAFREGTPVMASRLRPIAMETNTQVGDCLQALGRLGRDDPLLGVGEYEEHVRRCITSSVRLHEAAMRELESALNARRARLEGQKYLVAWLSWGALGLVAYLLVGFYVAVMETVHALEQATAGMVGGRFGPAVKLSTRDELGQVGSAFNAIASQLRTEWAQAREESSRARSAETALREAEAKYRGIFEHASEGIFQTTPNGQFLNVNPALAAIYGYESPEQLLAEIHSIPQQIYVRPEDRQEFLRIMRQQGAVANFETQIYRRDGSRLWIQESARSVLDEAGKTLYFEGILQDITPRKRAETEMRQAKEAAEQANQAKSAFLANMSHEIRTPMNSVIGMTGLLLETDLDEEQREFAQTIRRSAETLLAIINDILDFSKIEAGRLELEHEPFDVRDCLEGALDLLAGTAADKGLELALLIDPETPPAVYGDVTRLRQILLNLLSNAVKFTESGEIVVSVSARPHPAPLPPAAAPETDSAPHDPSSQPGGYELQFSVRDTGIGIPPDRMNRLFLPFSQVESSIARRYGGTGLGLVISRRFAEAMGGRMWVESQVGVGTTFYFTILAPAAPEVHSPLDNPDQPVLRGKRVLIVDDNLTNRKILRLRTESWGMVPRSTGTPQEALDWIRAGEEFAVALLDIQMPELDGVTLAREIRRHRTASALPLIACSSSNRREPDLEPGLFAAFVQKPLKISQIYNALLAVLAGQRLIMQDRKSERQIDPRMAEQFPLRILVAEDVAVNQRMMQLLLGRMGYLADLAGNGLEVLDAVQRQPYDVILMDVQMPEMDGLEATRRIQQQLPGEACPRIIALTAHAMKEDREACREAGMEDYLSKPVQARELQAALIRAFEARRPTARQAGLAPLPGDASDTPPPEAERHREASVPVLDGEILEDLEHLRGEGPDNFVRELVALFRHEGEKLVERIGQASLGSRADELRQAAHKLVGAASSIGAARLAATCAHLEQLAAHGDLASANSSAATVEPLFREACAALESRFDGRHERTP